MKGEGDVFQTYYSKQQKKEIAIGQLKVEFIEKKKRALNGKNCIKDTQIRIKIIMIEFINLFNILIGEEKESADFQKLKVSVKIILLKIIKSCGSILLFRKEYIFIRGPILLQFLIHLLISIILWDII